MNWSGLNYHRNKTKKAKFWCVTALLTRQQFLWKRNFSQNACEREIGHFRVHLSLHFKARVSAKSLLRKSVFIHIEIETNYHNKNFALRLTLKERLNGTRKWPIVRNRIHLRVKLVKRLPSWITAFRACCRCCSKQSEKCPRDLHHAAAILDLKWGSTGINNTHVISKMHNLFWVHCLCPSSLVSRPTKIATAW